MPAFPILLQKTENLELYQPNNTGKTEVWVLFANKPKAGTVVILMFYPYCHLIPRPLITCDLWKSDATSQYQPEDVSVIDNLMNGILSWFSQFFKSLFKVV